MKPQQAASHPTHEVAKKSKKSTAAPKSSPPTDAEVSTDDDGRIEVVRRTAYGFYEARSFEGGHALDDWLQAEAQVDNMSDKISEKSMHASEASGQSA